MTSGREIDRECIRGEAIVQGAVSIRNKKSRTFGYCVIRSSTNDSGKSHSSFFQFIHTADNVTSPRTVHGKKLFFFLTLRKKMF